MGLRLFLDECLSPRLVGDLYARGAELVVHPRDHGGLGQRDDQVLARCLDGDLVLVTINARDFRRLVATRALHPGLVVLPCVARAESLALLDRVLAHLGPDPMGVMVNAVVEVAADGRITAYALPRA